jgi:transcriptional regulator with XRE-family HTH domain
VPRVASDAAAYIGKRIAEQRALAGFTQDQLAVAANIDSSNLRAYESGRSLPNIRLLVRIATALSVEPGVFLNGLTPEIFGDSVEPAQRKAG